MVMHIHLVLTCALNVCLVHFLGQTWGLIQCLAIQEGGKGNHQEQVGELIKETVASIDDLALKMLFITVQQNNLEICIKYAVNKYVLLFSAIASTYSLYLRYIFKHDTIVRHFHIIADIPMLK